MTTLLEPNAFTATQFTQKAVVLKPKSNPCAEAQAARRRFFAEHGPGAPIRRRLGGAREFRKAVFAIEMSHWECF